MSTDKKITYSDNERAIVAALKNAPEGMTLAQLIEATGLDIKPGHMVSAAKKGLIASIGDMDITRPAKRKVSTYVFVTADVLKNEKDKEFNYTDNERNVLAAASQLDGEFTLAELASAMGVEKLSSGSINGLVKKGNIRKGDTEREIVAEAKAKVKVYGFKADIPAD